MNPSQINKLAAIVASDQKAFHKAITKPNPKDYTIANFRLKQWARGYLMHDRREIIKDTGGNCSGSLGQQVKRNNKDNNIYDDVPFIEIDDSQYRRLNTVMLSMTPYNRMFLNRHYIERAQYIEKCVAGGILPKRASQLFLSLKVRVTKNMYTLDLGEAQEEFLLRGGF